MKLKLKRPFVYQDGPRKTVTLPIGVHDLDADLASKVLRFGKAEIVVGKKAPKNKARGKPAENKAGVGGKSKHRSSKRTKPNT